MAVNETVVSAEVGLGILIVIILQNVGYINILIYDVYIKFFADLGL